MKGKNILLNTKELQVGVDEFTVVISLPAPVNANQWLPEAEIMIMEFLRLSKIETVFGKLLPLTDRLPKGYTQGLTIDNADCYFAVALHEHFQNLGIIIKWSAHSWALYQKKYSDIFNQGMNIYVFLKMIQSDLYNARLSRIDLTADYKNYGEKLKPDNIYNRYVNKDYRVCDCNEKYSRHTFNCMKKDDRVDCFYIGSRKANTKSFMRVYDKKLEQIQKSGFRLQEALQCEDWTRFEVSYRQAYAHQITEQLNKLNSNIELSRFIASKVLDKYRFVDVSTEEYTDFTSDLLDVARNSNYSALRYEAPTNNSLTNSIRYIIKGSGLFAVLFKIESIWGEEAITEFFEKLLEIYQIDKEDFYKDYKIRAWLKNNRNALSQQSLSDCFLGTVKDD